MTDTIPAAAADLSAALTPDSRPTSLIRALFALADAQRELAAASAAYEAAQAEVLRLQEVAESAYETDFRAAEKELQALVLEWTRAGGDGPASLATLKNRVRVLDRMNADAQRAREAMVLDKPRRTRIRPYWR